MSKVDELRTELDDLNKRLEELISDNTTLKINVNTLVERLDQLEGTETSIKKHSRPKSARRASAKKKMPRSISKDSVTGSDAASLSSDEYKGSSTRSSPRKKLRKVKKKKKKPKLSSKPVTNSTEISEDRKGSYYVGKNNVHYVAPADYKEQQHGTEKEPSVDLQLEFTYGYNGKSGRNNLFYIDKESARPRILYSLAAVGVAYNPGTKEQSHFIGHNEDILSLCIHPTKPLAATGQLDPKGKEVPYLCIWDYNTMKLIKKIPKAGDRGICAVGFTHDGKYLASIGEDDAHTLCIWDWKKGEKIASSTSSKEKVYGITFDTEPAGKGYRFCTYGSKMAKTWHLTKDGELTTNQVKLYAKTGKIQKAFLCAAYVGGGNVALGGIPAPLCVCNEKGEVVKLLDRYHEKGVQAICRVQDGFATTSTDGAIGIWSPEFALVGNAQSPGATKPKAMDWCPANGGTLVIGTSSNAIYEIPLNKGEPSTIMEGHTDEIWALAVHPSANVVVSGAHDNVLYCWDTDKRCVMSDKSIVLKHGIGSAAFSPDGSKIAVGMKNGSVTIVDFDSFEVVYSRRLRKEQIDAINYSPNGQLIAIGSWDQTVELLETVNYETAQLKGHTSSVTHVTFSKDSLYLMSNSRDYEALFWSCAEGKRVEAVDVADVEWDHWQCILGWPVRGIWQKGMDGTDINAVHVSGDTGSKRRYLAVGDDFGRVLLFRYPAATKSPAFKKYIGHSAHVTNVRWSADGSHLYSAGGGDTGLFQWKVV